MPQLILNDGADVRHEPVGTDADFPDVLADLDMDEDSVPDSVAEYARVRLGETDESRTRLLAELEDMIYGKQPARVVFGTVRGRSRSLCADDVTS